MRTIFAFAIVGLTACSSVYHPEFHPVNLSNYSQNLSYPVMVEHGGDPAARSALIIAPAPPPTPER